jgi:hypothetical protein
MTRGRRRFFGLTPLVLGFSVLSIGCEAETVYCPHCYPYYPPSGPAQTCAGGVDEAGIDTEGLLDLEPGEGVGATVEYLGEGGWRFAVTCDTLITGASCNWRLLVAPIDGTIDGFEAEELELEDLIERFPTTAGSSDEDGVLLDSITDTEYDAFAVQATPGTGVTVTATLDGYCAGPYVFWLEDGEVVHSHTASTDLFPE